MSFKDVINLCNTNYEFSSICRSNSTWQYLIQRDFNIIYNGENAYKQYLTNIILSIFSKYTNIITQDAIDVLINYIPFSVWNELVNVIGEGAGFDFISVNEIYCLCSVIGFLYEDLFGPNILYPGFEDMVDEIIKDCNKIDLYTGNNPITILCNGVPSVISFNVDLLILIDERVREKFGAITCTDKIHAYFEELYNKI